MTGQIETDILIIGGGLSGLRLADLLHQSGRDFLLVESRGRFGGRVLSHTENGTKFDFGPAWFWQGQPRMAGAVDRFGLPVFEQWTRGDFRFEDTQGRLQQGSGLESAVTSLRIAGGMSALTDALLSTLPQNRMRKNSHVAACENTPEGIFATCSDNTRIKSQRLVLALPPRVAASIAFSPDLPLSAMRGVQTWMAGQAKALALYDRPFWRELGLSGQAMSHRGPLVEVHDASPVSNGPAALFGFIGIPPAHRNDANSLKRAIVAQVSRLFGPNAPAPNKVIIKDWATDPATAAQEDLQPISVHPKYGLPPALSEVWKGSVVFSGTEVAEEFGGYLEGALESAEAAYQRLSTKLEPA